MAYEPVDAVEVWIWGERAGAVALDRGVGYYAFEYDPRFRASGIELAPLHVPLSTVQPVVFADLPEATFRRLPAFLADALPDDFGNALINAWMARQGVGAARITPLDRLAYMNKRAFGALEFRPARGSTRVNSTALDLTTLVESARKVLAGSLRGPTEASAALMQIFHVGTSAGGARAKAAVAWNPRTNELRAGQFDAPAGFEHWLLKFDGVDHDGALGDTALYGRIEYAYHLMALEAGIAMSDCRLLEENGRAHFMTKRFDRNVNEKRHLQSLCAMAHLDYRAKAVHAYEQLFDTMAQLSLPEADQEQAFRRMVLNVACANCDDHPKNHAFVLDQGATWRLAPAYDITHSYRADSEWVNQHLMSVNGRFSEIGRADCLVIAERFGVPGARAMVDDVLAAATRWPEHAGAAGMPRSRAAAVAADFRLASLRGRPR